MALGFRPALHPFGPVLLADGAAFAVLAVGFQDVDVLLLVEPPRMAVACPAFARALVALQPAAHAQRANRGRADAQLAADLRRGEILASIALDVRSDGLLGVQAVPFDE